MKNFESFQKIISMINSNEKCTFQNNNRSQFWLSGYSHEACTKVYAIGK